MDAMDAKMPMASIKLSLYSYASNPNPMASFLAPPPLDPASPLDAHCTYPLTMTTPTVQSTFICFTCSPPSETGATNICVCQACADMCHAGHDVAYAGMAESYCDCITQGCCEISAASNKAARNFQNVIGNKVPKCTCSSDQELSAEQFKAHTVFPSISTSTIPASCRTLITHTKETHWLPLVGNTTPLSDIETLVSRILTHHLATLPVPSTPYDATTGAEWWVQVKPLTDPTPAKTAIDLHYDKDEDLAATFALGNFPDLSTVTYLTGGGLPTVVFDHCYSDGEERDINVVRVSYPVKDKHVVFNGGLLHGVPGNEELLHAYEPYKGQTGDEVTGDGVRITLLVNVWVQNRPMIDVLPASIRATLGAGVDMMGRVTFRESAVGKMVWEGEEGEGENDVMTMHFVSNGSTWIEGEDERGEGGEGDEEEFEGLVLQMPIIKGLVDDTTEIRLLGASAAHLVHMGDDMSEEYEDDEEEIEEAFDAIEISTGKSL